MEAYVKQIVDELGLAEQFPGLTWTDADYGVEGCEAVKHGTSTWHHVRIRLVFDGDSKLMRVEVSWGALGRNHNSSVWRPRTKAEMEGIAALLREAARADLEAASQRCRLLGLKPGLP